MGGLARALAEHLLVDDDAPFRSASFRWFYPTELAGDSRPRHMIHDRQENLRRQFDLQG
jgi:hypothetical protein